jgi:hypothetical protein
LQLSKGKVKTIILTYPGFQSLPKGLKQMLVASESFFFGEAKSVATNANDGKPKDAKTAQFPMVAGFHGPLERFAGA